MQINCSYYSAVGNNDDWYLLARAIQFFTPGIPLVYYVGLLAGPNDIELVEATKNGRDINRHPYEYAEAVEETERPVVKVRHPGSHFLSDSSSAHVPSTVSFLFDLLADAMFHCRSLSCHCDARPVRGVHNSVHNSRKLTRAWRADPV